MLKKQNNAESYGFQNWITLQFPKVSQGDQGAMVGGDGTGLVLTMSNHLLLSKK